MKVRNSRFFTISLLLHLILVTILGSMVLFRVVDQPDDMEVLTKAMAYIVRGQRTSGGWAYSYGKGSGDDDTSVTGWQIQALKAEHFTGLNLPGVEAAMDKSMNYLKGAQDPKTDV